MPTLDQSLDRFVKTTAKTTVAVVVPLYGYWNDVPENPVNGEVLAAVMRRIYSNIHHLILIFVAHPQTIPHDDNDPESVAAILLAKSQGGNVLNIPVGRDATYAEYVSEGIHAALNDTKASFVIVVNPWVMVQEGALDVLIERANFGDEAKIVSGFDVRTLTEPESFDNFSSATPKEELDLSLDFLCVPRYALEMMTIDPVFQTHKFLERDLWQQIFARGFAVITSQRIPIFPFDFPWTSYETRPQFEADRSHFSSKWHFDPGLEHTDN